MTVPGEGFCSFQVVPRDLSLGGGGGGGWVDEIDTCISHRHVKSWLGPRLSMKLSM